MRHLTLTALVATLVSFLTAPAVSAAESPGGYFKLIPGCWLGSRKFDVYHADGTWGVKRNEDAPEDIRGRRWRVEGDKLVLTFPGDNGMATSDYTILSCTEQKLVLDAGGRRQEYTRYSADCQRPNAARKSQERTSSNRQEIVLLSFSVGSKWVFALVSTRQYTALDQGTSYVPEQGDYTPRGQVRGVSELMGAFGKIPAGATVTWRNALRAGASFPPRKIIEQVQSCAAARRVDLQVVRMP